MAIEENDTVSGLSRSEVLRYGLRYMGSFLLVWFTLSAIFYVFPNSRYSGSGVVITIGAASVTYARFLKDKLRLPSRSEYWGLVCLSTALCIVMELLISLLLIAQGVPMLDSWFWLGLIAWVGVAGFFTHMIFYSSFLGGITLRRMREKAAR